MSVPEVDQQQLIRRIGRALLGAAPQEWKRIRAEYRSAGRHIEVDVVVTADEGQPFPIRPPMEVVELFGELRGAMYRPGRGTWLSGVYLLDHPSKFSAEFEPDTEPRWRRPPPPIGFQDELRQFPREDAHIPNWLRARAGLPPLPDPAAEAQQPPPAPPAGPGSGPANTQPDTPPRGTPLPPQRPGTDAHAADSSASADNAPPPGGPLGRDPGEQPRTPPTGTPIPAPGLAGPTGHELGEQPHTPPAGTPVAAPGLAGPTGRELGEQPNTPGFAGGHEAVQGGRRHAPADTPGGPAFASGHGGAPQHHGGQPNGPGEHRYAPGQAGAPRPGLGGLGSAGGRASVPSSAVFGPIGDPPGARPAFRQSAEQPERGGPPPEASPPGPVR